MTFAYIYFSQRHLACHSDEKKFECDICGRKVTSLNTMRGHMRIHSGETPFVCEFCGKKFRASGGLKVWTNVKSESRRFSLLYLNFISCDRCIGEFIQVSGLTHAKCASHITHSRDMEIIAFTWIAIMVWKHIFVHPCQKFILIYFFSRRHRNSKTANWKIRQCAQMNDDFDCFPSYIIPYKFYCVSIQTKKKPFCCRTIE